MLNVLVKILKTSPLILIPSTLQIKYVCFMILPALKACSEIDCTERTRHTQMPCSEGRRSRWQTVGDMQFGVILKMCPLGRKGPSQASPSLLKAHVQSKALKSRLCLNLCSTLTRKRRQIKIFWPGILKTNSRSKAGARKDHLEESGHAWVILRLPTPTSSKTASMASFVFYFYEKHQLLRDSLGNV